MSSSARWAVILILLFVVLAMGISLVAIWAFTGGEGAAPWRHTPVLSLRLDGAIPELKADDPFSRFANPEQIDLRDIVDGLTQAQTDSGIDGVFVEIGAPQLGWAQNEEVRAAIERFKTSGKWVTCYMETAGEFSGGNGAYMLGTACSKLYMSPPGDIGLVALRVETPFVKGMFDKLGVVPQFGQRKEFKNAVNTYTETDYTPAHREATTQLLLSLNAELVESITKGRKLPADKVQQLIDKGPYTGPESKQFGLVDDLKYRDEVRDEIVKQAGRDEPFVSLQNYLDEGRPHTSGGTSIALVYAVGGVARGPSGNSPLSGESMGSDTVVDELRRAKEDSDVAAVVLRVDSPGGSYVASDLIRREVELVKQAKPVVISMGNYAASGGYFISMQGSKIYADSATLTGSIGVFSGKMVTSQFWSEKVGMRWGGVSLGESSKFYSTQELYDEHGTERMNAMLDRIYSDFVGKAAQGRGMSFDQLEPLAHGRVWTGRDALARKLIDEVGGVYDAIRGAATLAKLDPDGRYTVKLMRREAGFFDRLAGRSVAIMGGLSPETARVLQTIGRVTAPQPVTTLRDPMLPEIP
ncbi:MAG: signal peptide peptidase SppA [Acidobacteriota bacterium]